MSKKKFVITPIGTAKFPALNSPDTKWVAEGEYKVDLLYHEDELEDGSKLADFVADMEARLEAFVEEKKANDEIKKAKVKTLKLKPILGQDADKDGEETEYVFLRAKLRALVTPKGKDAFEQRPDIFDTAHKKPLENPPQIWGGSRLQLSVEPIFYYSPKDNEAGVSFRLKAVRIIELVSGGSRDADGYGFDDDVEGYEADEDDSAPFDTDDSDDNKNLGSKSSNPDF